MVEATKVYIEWLKSKWSGTHGVGEGIRSLSVVQLVYDRFLNTVFIVLVLKEPCNLDLQYFKYI